MSSRHRHGRCGRRVQVATARSASLRAAHYDSSVWAVLSVAGCLGAAVASGFKLHQQAWATVKAESPGAVGCPLMSNLVLVAGPGSL